MWEGLVNGCSGITRLTDDWTEHVPVGIGGRVPGFDSSDYLSSKEQRRIPRVSQFAIVGALQAADDAGLPPASLDTEGERVAVVMGTTMGPHPLAESMTTKYRGNGHRRPNPISFVNCLPNMPAHYVSQFLHARGPLQTPIAACATGTQAIGDAAELIRAGRADVVFAGGTEAILVDYVIAGFASLSALAEGYEQDPAAASRPFDADRGGFVLSEGCGVLVLENLAHARARGAEIYAEVVGHASTSDAHHIAQIDPNARGMIGAVQGALDDARLPAEAIGAVNAHGTGTEPNDRLETRALRHVLGPHAESAPVTANKSMLGHLMAAAGAVEGIAAVMTLKTGVLPPTINLNTPDPNCDLDYTPNAARQLSGLRYILSNNFGLGGQNASVVFGAL